MKKFINRLIATHELVRFNRIFIAISFVLLSPISLFSSSAIERQVQYLSGTDNVNTVTWDFFCTGGRNSGYWTKIEVPSCWEQQGFGTYNYGRDYKTYGKKFRFADEKGIYWHQFSVPNAWQDRVVYLIFEGSMTDTEVQINGKPAGEKHQGSFYRFKFDVTDKLHFDKPNLLEVTVSKMSSNHSVNRAERYADYWIFGGIFRPVYLEAYPKEFIERTAIVAEADGSFAIDVFLKNLAAKREIHAEIRDSNGNLVGAFSAPANKEDSLVTLRYKVDNPALWTSETPTLYAVHVFLKKDKKTLYQTSEKFGFRTITIRPGDGIYLNGARIIMKGINRHSFWPETGRSVSRQIDWLDVKLIKEMNMNAVRTSHYPPDEAFLQTCDSLGLYVLDELAGWQDAYDTEVGAKLVKEMVLRDVNHPSIIFWSNGNEGGTNKELDDDFLIYDPSKRPVIHAHHRPGNAFNHIDTNHYEGYESTKRILADSLIYMTTEFLHCQSDGGGGAGLSDYWKLLRTSPKSGGGFLWALLDEGIVRTDRGGIIDVNVVNAPDGVLGPHREKEGSFYAIKEIFTPVYIPMKKLPDSFDGTIPVENRFHFTNVDQCEFKWELVTFSTPSDLVPGHVTMHKDSLAGSNIKPGEAGVIKLTLPGDWRKAEALLLTAFDPFGNEILKWSWKIKDNVGFIQKFLTTAGDAAVAVAENDSLLIVTANEISVAFSKTNGLIAQVENKNAGRLNFKNGPVLCSGEASFVALNHFPEDDGYVVEMKYAGAMTYARWKMYKSGWLKLDYAYELKGKFNFMGISFDYSEEHVISAKWLGNGPYRVWKNRRQGVVYDVWENAYNNTITGTHPWLYPEFKGYFSEVTWIELNTVEGKFLVASPDDHLFVRLFDFHALPGLEPHPVLPPGDISFLDGIPPTGTKMTTYINARPEGLGPESQPNEVDGKLERTLWFYFGALESRKLETGGK